MALIDTFAAAQDPRVISQVTSAIYLQAENVYVETGVTNHAARAVFATKIVTGLQNLQPLILSACAFATLTAQSTDAAVSNAVAALWNLWAGA